MTVLLQRAIGEIEKLPDERQNQLASIILEEMLSERRWDEAFGRSQDALAKLAEEALEELHNGAVTPLDFDRR